MTRRKEGETMGDDPYRFFREELANEIILTAAKDYRQALCCLKKSGKQGAAAAET